jgi:hypothetical protein
LRKQLDFLEAKYQAKYDEYLKLKREFDQDRENLRQAKARFDSAKAIYDSYLQTL